MLSHAQNSLKPKSVFFFPIIFGLAWLSPLTPKIGNGESFNITILEIGLIALLILYPRALLNALVLKTIRPFSLAFLFILISTLWGSIYLPDAPGMARLLKFIIYFQLFYIGYYYISWRKALWLGYSGILAMILNLLFYFLYQVPKFGYDNWNVEAISSGFANKFISLPDFQFGTIMTGAHGIWLTYCLLCTAISLSTKHYSKYGKLLPSLSILLLLVNTAVSVSREGFLAVAIFLALSGVHLLNKLQLHTRIIIYKIIFICIFLLATTFLTAFLSLDFGIFEKINYTAQSYSTQGTEGNIQIRLNSWIAYIMGAIEHPYVLLSGVGWSNERFGVVQGWSKLSIFYISLPESLFFTFFAYGGILSLIAFCIFYRRIISKCLKADHMNFIAFFLISIIPGGLFSGAALISDLVMSQLFLILGFAIRQAALKRR